MGDITKVNMFLRILVACFILSISSAYVKNKTDYLYNDYSYDYEAHPKSNLDVTKYIPAETRDVVKLNKIGNVKGNMGYKVIKNRSIHAFFGLKYGIVSKGLGRFQVS